MESNLLPPWADPENYVCVCGGGGPIAYQGGLFHCI